MKRNKIILIFTILFFIEFCLQTISMGRYLYGKILFHRQMKQKYDAVWVNKDSLYRWWYDEFPHIIASYAPYINEKTADMITQHITVKDGIRKTVGNPTQIDFATKNVYMFGGSTMWGYLAKDEETIPSFLTKELNNNGAWQVTNFSDIGYSNFTEIIKFMLLLRQGNVPDIAIFYDGCNDLGMNIPVGSKTQQDLEKTIAQQLGNIDDFARGTPPANRSIFSKDAIRRLGDFVFTYIKVIRYPMQLARSLTHEKKEEKLQENSLLNPKSVREFAAKIASGYQQNARILESLSQVYGFRYVLIWQPLIVDKKPLTVDEKKFVDYYETFVESGPIWNEVKTLLKQSAIHNFYDISDIFSSNEKTVFFDRCHITPEGNRIVAEKIKSIIE